MKFRSLAAAFAALASLAAAQGSVCGTPFTTLASGGNGQSGVMFDIENISANPITICGMDVNLDMSAVPQAIGVWTVTAGTSHVPVATTAASWTQQAFGSTLSLGTNTTGVNNPFTPIPSALSIVIAPGQKLGFAVGCTTNTFINYTSGTNLATSVNQPQSNDGVLRWWAGYGKSNVAGVGPFGTNFGSLTTGGRLANVRVGYFGGVTTPNWELNDAASSMDLDGVATQFASAIAPSVRNQCVNNTTNVNLASTNVGLGYEVVYGLAPLVAAGAGAIASTGGQLLNVDLTDPTVTFLHGLSLAVPFANQSIPFAAPIPLGVSAQMANIDPANPDLIALSAAVRFQSNPTSSTITYGPSGLSDDGFYNLTAGALPTSPTCLTAIPAFSFYGTTFTEYSVAMNGRIMIGATTFAGDFSATVAEGLSQTPFAGCWTDMNPLAGGATASVAVDWTSGTNLNVAYNNIVYFGTTSPQFSYSINLDSATGAIWISGINNLPAGTASMFLGMTRGNTGATDPGATAFAVGNGSAANANDMLYAFGTNGSLAPGVASIVFTPNMGGGYDWVGF